MADTRERAVWPFIETAVAAGARASRQINTGDYLVCRAPGSRAPAGAEPAILACIERKTHADFAASFKDGRYANRHKMTALREQTGCQLFFFVEGPAFPSLNRRFARIPYANILAAITLLMVRDGIFIVQTEDERHTAARLADLLRAFEDPGAEGGRRSGSWHPGHSVGGAPGALGAPGAPGTPGTPGAPDAPDAPDAGLDGDAGADAAQGVSDELDTPEGVPDEPDTPGGPETQGPAALAVPASLLTRIELPDGDAVAIMWARLRGVSVAQGKILTQCFSIAGLAGGEVPVAAVRGLKMTSGRAAGRAAVAALLAVRSGDRAAETKVVSGATSVTPAVAAVLLEFAGGLAALCRLESRALAQAELAQKNRTVRFGETRAARLLRLLRFREPGDAPLAAAPCAIPRDASRAIPRVASHAASRVASHATAAPRAAARGKRPAVDPFDLIYGAQGPDESPAPVALAARTAAAPVTAGPATARSTTAPAVAVPIIVMPVVATLGDDDLDSLLG